jgi:hypothetical protein
MTDKQPEALRLADWIERGNYNHEDVTKAAAELRRLHEVNAELVEALQEVARANSSQVATIFAIRAKAAIVKATGEQQ